jgi:hypothetical protein|tara:strand:+ start:602 stop:802 length:201 start_codon:yes stop_codon:yes gene_type:complete
MESLKTILDKLKEFHSWGDVWKETEHKLADRERKLATEYARYCMDKKGEEIVLSYEIWLSKTKLEE